MLHARSHWPDGRPDAEFSTRKDAQPETETLTAILAAARHLFHSPGYAVTRVADIAHEAGVSSATVYNHFADKKSILYQIVRDYMAGYAQIGVRLKARIDPSESIYQLLRNPGQRRHAVADRECRPAACD